MCSCWLERIHPSHQDVRNASSESGGEKGLMETQMSGKVERFYPKVLMNPLVVPSAYREHMSPMWRKLDILSDMVPWRRRHLQQMTAESED